MPLLFPFADYWGFYLVFTAFVLGMLALDLGVFHRQAHTVSFKESFTWTLVWISLALVFNVIFYYYALWRFTVDPRYLNLLTHAPNVHAYNVALEFLTGFVVEKALAFDNIFVFALVFTYFNIPPQYQHRVLFWGIIGALFFRAVFIALGAFLMQYAWVVWFFGGLLILTGIKLFFVAEKPVDLGKNPVIRWMERFFPVYPHVESQAFYIKKDGKYFVTPLFFALIFIEISDIVFAIDSVPAIFAITREPLIVYTSNVFAILGLRSLYFMLSGMLGRFQYIKYGLAAVLVFVGLKMVYLNDAFGGKFPITWSLGIIVGLIGSSIVYSVWRAASAIEQDPKPDTKHS